MKKYFIGFVAVMALCCGNVLAGTTDDIRDACYATRKCGGRDFIQANVVINATLAGAATGAAVGSLLGVGGSLVGIAGGGYGGYVVGQNFGGKLAKFYDANEYMYFDDGSCIQCDTYQLGEHYECPNGTILSNGSQFYRCRTEVDGDFWDEMDAPLPCPNSPIKDVTVKNSLVELKATVSKPVASGVSVFSGDVCAYITCGEGKLDAAKNECVSNTQGGGDGGATPVPPVKPNPVPQNCKQKRATDEGKACCDVEPVGAKWENNQCVCPNGMKFEMDAKTKAGRCMPIAGASFDCPASVTALLAEYRVKCALKPAIMAVIKEIDDLCKSSTRTAERYNALMATLNALHPENCASGVAEGVIEHSTTQVERRITDATALLESMADGLKVTVWKNEDGKFNTARLASDSIAGVVLGTTGALVTSSVVKKNQVENGFEDIQCTVGGQVVASWGDEFRVGIQ